MQRSSFARCLHQFDMQPLASNNDCKDRSFVGALRSQRAPLRKVCARRMGVVFRVSVPFAQVPDRASAGAPTALRYRTMAERHALKERAPLPVHTRRGGRLRNEHPLSVNGT